MQKQKKATYKKLQEQENNQTASPFLRGGFVRRITKCSTINEKIAFIDGIIHFKSQKKEELEKIKILENKRMIMKFYHRLKSAIEKRKGIIRNATFGNISEGERSDDIEDDDYESLDNKKVFVINRFQSQRKSPYVHQSSSYSLTFDHSTQLPYNDYQKSAKKTKNSLSLLHNTPAISIGLLNSKLAHSSRQVDTPVSLVSKIKLEDQQVSYPRIMTSSRISGSSQSLRRKQIRVQDVGDPHFEQSIIRRKSCLLKMIQVWKDALEDKNRERFQRLNSPRLRKRKMEIQKQRIEKDTEEKKKIIIKEGILGFLRKKPDFTNKKKRINRFFPTETHTNRYIKMLFIRTSYFDKNETLKCVVDQAPICKNINTSSLQSKAKTSRVDSTCCRSPHSQDFVVVDRIRLKNKNFQIKSNEILMGMHGSVRSQETRSFHGRRSMRNLSNKFS